MTREKILDLFNFENRFFSRFIDPSVNSDIANALITKWRCEYFLFRIRKTKTVCVCSCVLLGNKILWLISSGFYARANFVNSKNFIVDIWRRKFCDWWVFCLPIVELTVNAQEFYHFVLMWYRISRLKKIAIPFIIYVKKKQSVFDRARFFRSNRLIYCTLWFNGTAVVSEEHVDAMERIFRDDGVADACVTDAKKRRDARFHWKIEPRTSRAARREALARNPADVDTRWLALRYTARP